MKYGHTLEDTTNIYTFKSLKTASVRINSALISDLFSKRSNMEFLEN